MKPPATSLVLLISLGLTACGDYYGTTYRYPTYRTYTQTQTYRHTVPVPPPVNSQSYSLHKEYEINHYNYYGSPTPPDHDTPHSDDHHQDGYQYRVMPQPTPAFPAPYPRMAQPPAPYQGMGQPEPRVSPPDQSRPARTYGQQEFDKKMEQLRQRTPTVSNLAPQSDARPGSIQERIRQKREQQGMESRPRPGRADRQEPNPTAKNRPNRPDNTKAVD